MTDTTVIDPNDLPLDVPDGDDGDDRTNDPKKLVAARKRMWARADFGDDPVNSCHEWTGHTIRGGYGMIQWGGRQNRQVVHRVAYEERYGPIEEGMVACHKCDNPKCMRPDHIFIGTQEDNIRDAISKGRHAGKLSMEIARVVRSSPETGRALAIKFGVNETIISDIRLGKTWKEKT